MSHTWKTTIHFLLSSSMLCSSQAVMAQSFGNDSSSSQIAIQNDETAAQLPNFEAIQMQNVQSDALPFVDTNDQGDLLATVFLNGQWRSTIYSSSNAEPQIIPDFIGRKINNRGQILSATTDKIYTPEVGVQTINEYTNGKMTAGIFMLNDNGTIAGTGGEDCPIFLFRQTTNQLFCAPQQERKYKIEAMNNHGDLVGYTFIPGSPSTENRPFIVLAEQDSVSLHLIELPEARFTQITDERLISGFFNDKTLLGDANDLGTFYTKEFPVDTYDSSITDVGFLWDFDHIYNLATEKREPVSIEGCDVEGSVYHSLRRSSGVRVIQVECSNSRSNYAVIQPKRAYESVLSGELIAPQTLATYELTLVSEQEEEEVAEPAPSDDPVVEQPETPSEEPNDDSNGQGESTDDTLSPLEILQLSKQELKQAIRELKQAKSKRVIRVERKELRQALKAFRTALKTAKDDGLSKKESRSFRRIAKRAKKGLHQ